LVVKSFGSLIDPPSYLYGCTSLGDGSLIPVIDSSALLAFEREQKTAETLTAEAPQRLMNGHIQSSIQKGSTVIQSVQVTTILVVDDAVTLRRTLALSLERAGFRVLQARDGREAIDQCQRSSVNLMICDIEMPNMNGFEFLIQIKKNA
jgi:chemotaxis family two-component system sensor histidine kinase/response regulator PixL